MSKDDVVTTTKALEALDLLDEDGQMASTQAYHTLLRYIHQQDRRALSHAAGQDGEQCRAASGLDRDYTTDERAQIVNEFYLTMLDLRGAVTEEQERRLLRAGLLLRALSRGVPEGDDSLPRPLWPVSKEWYRLCERRFAVDRITISGKLAEAIVDAVCGPAIAAQRKEGE